MWLGPQYDVRYSSVTPDGRLVATSSWFKDPDNPDVFVKVWETVKGSLVTVLPIKAHGFPVFSSDGSRLGVYAGGKFRLFETGSWREALSLEGEGGPFTPDGRHFVQERTDAILRLLEVATGREIVALDNPQQLRGSRRCISPDGRHLLFASADLAGVHVWDLHAVRRGLAALGLDWSSESLPADENGLPSPLQVSLEGITPELPPEMRGVVVLPAPGRKPATAEEIALWMRQLSDPDGKKRQAAAEALAAAGQETVKALTMAFLGDPRKQTRAVLNRIAVREALTPTRVRLRLKEASLASALHAFAQQTGIAVKLQPPPAGHKPRAITLMLDDVSAWEALRPYLHCCRCVPQCSQPRWPVRNLSAAGRSSRAWLLWTVPPAKRRRRLLSRRRSVRKSRELVCAVALPPGSACAVPLAYRRCE